MCVECGVVNAVGCVGGWDVGCGMCRASARMPYHAVPCRTRMPCHTMQCHAVPNAILLFSSLLSSPLLLSPSRPTSPPKHPPQALPPHPHPHQKPPLLAAPPLPRHQPIPPATPPLHNTTSTSTSRLDALHRPLVDIGRRLALQQRRQLRRGEAQDCDARGGFLR